jgi:hypothetical protein
MSLHDTLIGVLETSKVPGFKAVRTSLNNVRKGLSDIDAELGYQAGGGQKKGPGAILFRDKDETNLVPVDFSTGQKRYIDASETIPIQHYEHFEYPSITKPVKALGNLIIPTLAFTKAIEVVQNHGGKKNEQNIIG